MVGAPAVGFAGADGAGVLGAETDVGPVVFDADLRGGELVLVGVAAEFSAGVVAPAVKCAGLDSAGMVGTGADVGPVAGKSYACRGVGVVGRVDAELPGGVVAPAVEFAGLDGAGKECAGGDEGPGVIGADADADAFGGGGIIGGAVAELAAGVVAPAVEFAGADAADVAFADGDILPVVIGADLLGGEVRIVGVFEVLAPAVERTFFGDGAGVVEADCDLYLGQAVAGVTVDIDGAVGAGIGNGGGVVFGVLVVFAIELVIGICIGGRVGYIGIVKFGVCFGVVGFCGVGLVGVLWVVGIRAGVRGDVGICLVVRCFVVGIVGAGGQDYKEYKEAEAGGISHEISRKIVM